MRIRQPDGSTLSGYRDSTGAHLRRPDGTMAHCQRQTFSAADIDIACR